MSPPLLGYHVVEGSSLLAEQRLQQCLPRNAQVLSDVAEEALNVPTRSEPWLGIVTWCSPSCVVLRRR